MSIYFNILVLNSAKSVEVRRVYSKAVYNSYPFSTLKHRNITHLLPYLYKRYPNKGIKPLSSKNNVHWFYEFLVEGLTASCKMLKYY